MKYLLIITAVSLSHTICSQGIDGQWVTFDDKTGEKKAIIEIYKNNDRYFAKITKSFVGEPNAICETCKGEKNGKPIVGLIIIEDLKKVGERYEDGTIMDPENGETYSCFLTLVNDNKLKVRGYLGLSIFGRTQYWQRKEI